MLLISAGEFEASRFDGLIVNFIERHEIAVIFFFKSVVAYGVVTTQKGPTSFVRAVLVRAVQCIAMKDHGVARLHNAVNHLAIRQYVR